MIEVAEFIVTAAKVVTETLTSPFTTSFIVEYGDVDGSAIPNFEPDLFHIEPSEIQIDSFRLDDFDDAQPAPSPPKKSRKKTPPRLPTFDAAPPSGASQKKKETKDEDRSFSRREDNDHVGETFGHEEIVVCESPLPRPRTRRPPAAPVAISPHFKLIFLTILGLTIASGLIELILAQSWVDPTANQQSTFEMFGTAWKTGLGAIFGLLTGKSIK